jgi:hypothetical protein
MAVSYDEKAQFADVLHAADESADTMSNAITVGLRPLAGRNLILTVI